ncbi:arf-GAP with dual PH domain-containing protein 2 isoform X2 [Rhinatrema bivittatum]|uniref:arf-GAP with dual PH domain-containing protein 2 isoform X2 n=1 Tax=Rhinatrema bivittatum TaxID=194408 RepID=UPI00112E1DC7|nr:arf-GAP with dual PH domain-containing protein 2 isoform X2 [Rhinatrema bivittatum]
MADRDGNRRALLQLLALPGNARCADCGAPDPDWASYKLGIFVCLNCSGIHRNFPEISKIKSTRLDFWDDDLVQHMRAHGNLRAKAKYEAAVPPHYYRPQPTDCLVLKEQWIRAKYEREEFTTDRTGPGTVSAGSKEGFLWKRGKDKAQFLLRRFVLSEKEGVLRYYTKDEIKGPKAIMPLKDLNAMFQAEKIGNPNGLQLTYVKGIQTRNVFVYHESGKEIVDWFTAIRAARLHYLKTEFPTTTESELIPRITRKYLKEGYMEKTGPTQRETFKKRWFTLDLLERKLLYYKDPMDAYEQGAVFIGSRDHRYQVKEGLPRGIRGKKWKDGITIATPGRQFLFTCENEKDQKAWMEALNEVISRPMTSQDYTEANFRRQR